MECSICYEEISHDTHITACKHTFHASCLKSWLHHHQSCPMCRALITKSSIFTQIEIKLQHIDKIELPVVIREQTLEEILAAFAPIHTSISVPRFIENT